MSIEDRLDGPAPVMEVALDLVKRGLAVAPLVVFVSALFWGADGAYSTAYGLAIVLANFFLAAALLGWGGRVSFAAMGAAALFGFLLRLGLICVAVLVVRDAAWVDLVPLGLTLIVTHLGLLFWEMRYVSASLAFPGLAPKRAAAGANNPANPASRRVESAA